MLRFSVLLSAILPALLALVNTAIGADAGGGTRHEALVPSVVLTIVPVVLATIAVVLATVLATVPVILTTVAVVLTTVLAGVRGAARGERETDGEGQQDGEGDGFDG